MGVTAGNRYLAGTSLQMKTQPTDGKVLGGGRELPHYLS